MREETASFGPFQFVVRGGRRFRNQSAARRGAAEQIDVTVERQNWPNIVLVHREQADAARFHDEFPHDKRVRRAGTWQMAWRIQRPARSVKKWVRVAVNRARPNYRVGKAVSPKDADSATFSGKTGLTKPRLSEIEIMSDISVEAKVEGRSPRTTRLMSFPSYGEPEKMGK